VGRLHRLLVLLAAISLAGSGLGCPSWPGRTGGSPPGDGNDRLGRDVVPERYVLDLAIDPARDRFSGESRIAVRVDAPTDRVALHAADMDFTRVEVWREGVSLAVSHESGPNGALLLRMAVPLPAGPAELRFAWTAPLPEAPFGLYRVKLEDAAYAFTQFEPLEARKAFPCFDQPEFKTPFATTLRVPRGLLALSNGPVVRREVAGDDEVFAFAETRPLSTYLVAFAVGDFDVVGPAIASGPPTRVVAVRGQGRLAGFALERAPVILRWLTDYFDHPYPFAKLDLVAVPNFGAGAMENVGLVTFRERLLLLDGERASLRDRRASQSVIAHELAHMWYGNLVTMAWWDDLWLNESFATWMAAKTLADVAPELETAIDVVRNAQSTMDLDSKRDARRIRQPIQSGGDVYNAFDGITYGKGAAVLRMLEAWIGEDVFREGVRAYMRQYAYGSGGTDELLAALEAASGRPVAATLERFLDQPGTPLVDVALECEAGRAPRLRLSQTRYLPAGSDAAAGDPWRVPVCVALGGEGGARTRECLVLADRQQEVPLATTASCPTWVHPNAGEQGYYRWRMAPERLVALATVHGGALDASERVALPGLYDALVEAGALPVEDHLRVLTHLAGDERHQVVEAVVSQLAHLARVGVPDPDSPLGLAFAEAVRGMLRPQLARVGPEPRADEPVAARLRRVVVLPALGGIGRDEAVLARARELAGRFLAAPDAVDAEMLELLLPLAARDGDEVLWEGLVAIALDPPSPGVRSTVVHSLGAFEDPQLLTRSLDLLIDGRLRAQDYRTVAGGVRAPQQPVAWAWLESRYAEIAGKLGPMTATRLPHAASGLCTREEGLRVHDFFASAPGVPSGTERNVRLVLEDIERCARMREAIQPGLARALVGNGQYGTSN